MAEKCPKPANADPTLVDALQNTIANLRRQLAERDQLLDERLETMVRLLRQRDAARAACAAIHEAACLARGAISSNYEGVSAHAKTEQMVEARRHLDPVCDQPNPGQFLRDRLATAEAVVENLPETADKVRVVPGMRVFRCDGKTALAAMRQSLGGGVGFDWQNWYSSPEAAESARAGEEKDDG